MLVGETHDSIDDPPKVPMFGGKQACGRSSTCGSDLNAGLTGMANSTVAAHLKFQFSLLALALSSKSIELRSKYMQQLRELVNLHEIGTLTT